MNLQEVSSRPCPSPKAHILSLPTEILQSIYLYCVSPHLARASPVLSSALSAELMYRITFLHAFWASTPLVFVGTQSQEPYEPGPNVRSLFQPLAVPRVDNDTHAQKAELQKTVLAYRWCNFNRAKLYFSSAIEAMTRDLFSHLDITLSSHDQARFDSFIVQNLSASRSTFEATALDGSQFTLRYPRRLATALLMKYFGHVDSRVNPNTSPNLRVRPTDVLVVPEHVLIGKPEWTEERVNLLQMLCSYVSLGSVQYEVPAFHEGMKNAIVQGNHDALLVLIWLADRLAEYKDTMSDFDNVFEPPSELFRLVARLGIGNLEIAERYSNSEGTMNPIVYVKLFTLLLRAHAESMPQNDADITAWATYLCTYQAKNNIGHQKFAQWVLDWSSQARNSEPVLRSGTRMGGPTLVRRQLFRRGNVSRQRAGDEIARRFIEICEGRLESFPNEVERVGSPSVQCLRNGDAHV